jgi:two-component system phosphate regulon sensor histidine kinase PhoR
LDNANKYSPETPEIAVKTSCNDKGVTISVSDKGLGMTQDQIRHIFQKFYRVHTGDRHDIKGFGLGLSYVKSLVEAHGGTIKVESKPNVGSRFDVFFPYQPQSMA